MQMRKDVKALDLVLKLDGDLLRSVPLRYLAKANITSSDEVNNKTWSQSQVISLNTSCPPHFIMFLHF